MFLNRKAEIIVLLGHADIKYYVDLILSFQRTVIEFQAFEHRVRSDRRQAHPSKIKT